MKKSLKTLKLDKQVISNLEQNKIEGGGTCFCGATNGAFVTCPPPGMQCF